MENPEVRTPYAAMSLHDHAAGWPCTDQCSHYPAGESVTTFFHTPECLDNDPCADCPACAVLTARERGK